MKNIEFNKFYKIFNIISLGLIILSIFLLFLKGLNYGVDFKGGTLIEIRTDVNKADISNIRKIFSQMNLGDLKVKQFGEKNDFILATTVVRLNKANLSI